MTGSTDRGKSVLAALVAHVYKAAIDNTRQVLTNPPGRRPDPPLVEASTWFNALDEAEQDRVMFVARLAADGTMFGLMCALDGARTILDDADHIDLVIVGRDGGREEISSFMLRLHEEYRSMVTPMGELQI